MISFARVCCFLLIAGETGWTQSASVSLAWDPSPDSIVSGYTIYYGAATRQYTNSIDVGLVTNAIVGNLNRGVTFFFAVTAHTTNLLESDFSNEVSTKIGATRARNLKIK